MKIMRTLFVLALLSLTACPPMAAPNATGGNSEVVSTGSDVPATKDVSPVEVAAVPMGTMAEIPAVQKGCVRVEYLKYGHDLSKPLMSSESQMLEGKDIECRSTGSGTTLCTLRLLLGAEVTCPDDKAARWVPVAGSGRFVRLAYLPRGGLDSEWKYSDAGMNDLSPPGFNLLFSDLSLGAGEIRLYGFESFCTPTSHENPPLCRDDIQPRFSGGDLMAFTDDLFVSFTSNPSVRYMGSFQLNLIPKVEERRFPVELPRYIPMFPQPK